MPPSPRSPWTCTPSPGGGDRKPLTTRKARQGTPPTRDGLSAWWSEHPDANAAILTGTPGDVTAIGSGPGHDLWPSNGQDASQAGTAGSGLVNALVFCGDGSVVTAARANLQEAT